MREAGRLSPICTSPWLGSLRPFSQGMTGAFPGVSRSLGVLALLLGYSVAVQFLVPPAQVAWKWSLVPL